MGKIIVLTGINGCGKTTQIRNLVHLCNKKGRICKSLKLANIQNPTKLELQANYADIIDHFEEEVKQKNNRFLYESLCMRYKIDTIICKEKNIYDYLFLDRYLESIFGIAKQYENGKEILETVFKGVILPDIAFLIDIDYQEALRRIKRREIEENSFREFIITDDLLEYIDNYYKNEFSLYEFYIIDGNKKIDTITKKIFNLLIKDESISVIK